MQICLFVLPVMCKKGRRNNFSNLFEIVLLRINLNLVTLTTISGFSNHSFLFTAEGSNKGDDISVVNLNGYDGKQTTYSVQEDITDVYLIRNGSYDVPSFDVLPGNPICAYKTLFTGKSYDRDKGAVIYIPEIRAGTIIKNYGASYIVY